MRLTELIDHLQEIAQDERYANAEVVAAIQPNYPLCVEIDAVTPDQGEVAPVVWIATGSHPYRMSPYAPKAAWDWEEIVNVETEEEEKQE